MKNIILVVDDDKTNLTLAQKILSPEYRIAACNSGMAALKYLEKNKPHLILLDISMPEMDGFEVLEKLRQDQRTEAIPIIFLTADGQSDTEVKCFQMGALDFVKKPFVPDILLSRVAKTIELDQYRHNLEDMVSEQAEKLMESTQRINRIQETVIVGMANLIESRDGSTGKHVKNTQMYVRMISEELQKRQLFAGQLTDSYIDDVCKAAPLHDVGKIKIPDAVLQKPGKLTPEEYDVIRPDWRETGSRWRHVLWRWQMYLMPCMKSAVINRPYGPLSGSCRLCQRAGGRSLILLLSMYLWKCCLC